MIRQLLQKYRSLISYGIFGVLTTLINIVCYQLLYSQLGVANVPSNIVAWVLSVAFAFITNKLWVFESKNMAPAVMLPELAGCDDLGVMMYAADGVYHIQNTFGNIANVVLYLVWLAALWFHLTHGFWSAMQTLGWNNKVWLNRWQCISNIYSTIVVLCFALVVVVFYIKSLI